ncbi:LOW QUALITY PROTEIN: arp2/3 complex-activating protein rickA-like [Metopolophium dirhodum]|uniref:LOW QUALITY PROTEIN: arp2/3 complex-activating protein rickA-like n=1 Tax=Metopolophium dirhodum TaxID=44670 RepID=UPI0029902521|nr:LOW QUALITY PROTEIN: arp2/3 complex-activating protein rickA-like [Metopolophium dirhodum]
MHLSNEFLIGITVVGITGISYLFSKYTNPFTGDRKLQNIKDDSEDDEQFFDAESGSDRFMSEENVYNVNQSKPISELYKDAVEKQAFGDMEYHFEKRTMNSLAWKFNMLDAAMQKIQYKVDEQALMIKSLKLGMAGVRTDLKTLIESFNVSRTQTTSAESNIIIHQPILTYIIVLNVIFLFDVRLGNAEKLSEKPNSCKLGNLKTRILILEREVTKNSSQIIDMDHSFRALLLGVGAAVTLPEENRFHRNPPNTYCHRPTTPKASAFTLVGSPPIPRPPPPPPSLTSDFGPPPPPPLPPTTHTPALQIGELWQKEEGSSKVAGPDKKATTKYCRIPITEEILKSVVLKPLKRT